MSQYTPTTEIVRSHFSASADEYGTRDGIALAMEEAETAFDRWHAEELRQAKEQAWDEGAGIAWRESGIRTYGNEYTELPDTGFLPFSVAVNNPYRSQP